MTRMNRDEFFRAVSPLDDARLRKALWNLYWRGTADMRARIESEIAGDGSGRVARPTKTAVDVEALRGEVAEFVSLARAGAYVGGDRRVSPRERTRWRFTFKRLASETQAALRSDDHAAAVSTMESLIDLACETTDYDHFRSEDAMEAAGFVVSDAAALLWKTRWERDGFEAFAKAAAPQLIQWESPHGWTRYGMGSVAVKETTLATVLSGMLRGDMWERFAEHYLHALSEAPMCDARRPYSVGEQRARALAQWHRLLLDNLDDAPGGIVEQIAGHGALAGPEQAFLGAQLAHRRDDVGTARKLITECLRKLPGHSGFRGFAAEIGVEV